MSLPVVVGGTTHGWEGGATGSRDTKQSEANGQTEKENEQEITGFTFPRAAHPHTRPRSDGLPTHTTPHVDTETGTVTSTEASQDCSDVTGQCGKENKHGQRKGERTAGRSFPRGESQ